MNIGKKYRQGDLQEKYDCIVIGSGLGGLTSAALLAMAGQRVLCLEQHYTVGGSTHVYSRQRYEWDIGLHYVGEVHKKASLTRQLFDIVSGGKLQWEPLDSVYDTFIFGDKRYELPPGKKAFEEQLKKYFPSEEQVIDAYLKKVSEFTLIAPLFFGERCLPEWLSWFWMPVRQFAEKNWFQETTREGMQRLGASPELMAVLTGQWGDYGLPPSESSFALHCLVAGHYLEGASYPIGGSAQIARTICAHIEKYGGEIRTGAVVRNIIVRENKACGVILKDGSEIFSDRIISNAGVYKTLNDLLNVEVKKTFNIQALLDELEPTQSYIGLCIGVHATAAELSLSKSNLWIYPSMDHDANVTAAAMNPDAPFPGVFISFPSVKDPTWQNRYPGRSTIQVIAPAKYDHFVRWRGSRWMERGRDYENYKSTLTRQLLQILYQHVPAIKGKVDICELSTPLTVEHFMHNEKGAMYGLKHNPKRFQLRWLRPDSPVKNLYFTGQDIVTAGISGALSSGLLTAISVLGLGAIRLIFPAVQTVLLKKE